MRAIEDISNFIFLKDQPQTADIIFIPGGSYPEIAEKAARLWKEGYADKILPSGRYSVMRGYFPGPLSKSEKYSTKYETEWDFLKDVLLQSGVDEEAVLREDKSQFTYENALFSKEVTDILGMKIKKALLCCKSFHARRCLMYYQLSYPETEFIICPSDVQGITKDNWHTTEKGIKRVMGELERCGSQFKDIFISQMLEKQQNKY
jgi:uncharacterized SAM-binding protein YcdF (DUF218 family)